MNAKFSNSRSSTIIKEFSQDFYPFNVNSPITAIASDLDCKFLAVGGRDCIIMLLQLSHF